MKRDLPVGGGKSLIGYSVLWFSHSFNRFVQTTDSFGDEESLAHSIHLWTWITLATKLCFCSERSKSSVVASFGFHWWNWAKTEDTDNILSKITQ